MEGIIQESGTKVIQGVQLGIHWTISKNQQFTHQCPNRKMVEDQIKSTDEQTNSIISNVKALAYDHKAKLCKLEIELEILKMAVRALNSSCGEEALKTKVLEPKLFSGGRNAKELENFLWDMSHYFKATRTPNA